MEARHHTRGGARHSVAVAWALESRIGLGDARDMVAVVLMRVCMAHVLAVAVAVAAMPHDGSCCVLIIVKLFKMTSICIEFLDLIIISIKCVDIMIIIMKFVNIIFSSS